MDSRFAIFWSGDKSTASLTRIATGSVGGWTNTGRGGAKNGGGSSNLSFQVLFRRGTAFGESYLEDLSEGDGDGVRSAYLRRFAGRGDSSSASLLMVEASTVQLFQVLEKRQYTYHQIRKILTVLSR